MKNMNMKERYWTINLQLFAGDGGDDDPGDEGGDDDNDDPGDDDDDSDDDDQEENEKKFSQKDVDDAVKKNDNISRIRCLSDNRTSRCCSKHCSDLHTFCNIIRMIDFFYRSGCQADLVTI